ncbi:MAG TPA: AarF/ABC1/UbiB kinase family protein [Alphaproteobacteria bacterium]|nr:AarF/ABC1/UbiB kinase family protein [Alphaproteobacteria bacterium]
MGLGGYAARRAGERALGRDPDRARNAAALRAALGGLKGPLMKVAQMIATIPDALPQEYADELRQLQASAPSMGWPFVRRRMAAELGPDWQARFRSFERDAAAAASLGQVHRASAKDGRLLAVKLQYPEMQSTVEADLRQLQVIFGIYGRLDRAIDTAEIHTEIGARLREELDYERESRHIRLYYAMLDGEVDIHVPEVLPELTTRRLLTMTWLEGRPLLPWLRDGPELGDRNRVARALFRGWYLPFYRYGTIHGDPHLGNYTVRPDRGVNLLDYGCIRIFRPSFVRGVIELYRALREEDLALAVHAYETWGFRGLTHEVIEILNQWARFLYAPLMDDRPRRIQEAASGQYGREVAEKVHADLKRVGGVAVPREFVFMDRAAIGLGSVFLHLKAELNWHRLFHELIDDFDESALGERQSKALEAVGLLAPA